MTWHQTLPPFGGEEHHAIQEPGDDEPMDDDEVPGARHADGVSVTGRSDERREVALIVVRRPQSVTRHLQGREMDPLAPRRAVVVEIEAGMIGENGEPAPNQQHDEQEIEEVAVANPHREARQRHAAGGGCRRDGRLPEHGDLEPRGRQNRHDDRTDADQDRGPNPDADATIRGKVHRSMRSIKSNHGFIPSGKPTREPRTTHPSVTWGAIAPGSPCAHLE